MIKFLKNSVILFSLLFVSLFSADPTFELVNDTNKRFYVAIGSEKNSPYKFKFDAVTPSDIIQQYIDVKKPDRTWIFITDQMPVQVNKSKVLSIKFKPNKKIFIEIVNKRTDYPGLETTSYTVKPQEKDPQKSTVFSPKNERGLSLSGNVSKSDMEQNVIIYDPSKESSETQEASKVYFEQKEKIEKERNILESDKKAKDLREKQEAQKRERDLKRQQEEQAKKEAAEKHYEALRLKEAEEEKQRIARREEEHAKFMEKIRQEQEKIAAEIKLEQEEAQRKYAQAKKEEQQRIQEQKNRLEQLSRERTQEPYELDQDKRAKKLKDREENIRIENLKAKEIELKSKELQEKNKAYQQEREQERALEEEQRRKANEKLNEEMKQAKEADIQAAQEEKKKVIKEAQNEIRKLDPKNIYLEIMLRKLSNNPTSAEILETNLEGLKVSKTGLKDLDSIYYVKVNKVHQWLKGEKSKIHGLDRLDQYSMPSPIDGSRLMHKSSIISLAKIEEKGKMVEEMLYNAYANLKEELSKEAPKFNQYSVLGLDSNVNPKTDFRKVLGIKLNNPTFSYLLIAKSGKTKIIDKASKNKTLDSRGTILARTMVIDAYEAAIKWLVSEKNCANPYVELGLTSAQFSASPLQILGLKEGASKSEIKDAYEEIKKSFADKPTEVKEPVNDLVEGAMKLAILNLASEGSAASGEN